MRLVPHLFRTLALVVVLGLVALTVPDSAVRPAELSLVKLKGADGVDVGDDVIWILAVGSDARPGQSMTRSPGSRSRRHPRRRRRRP